VANQLLSIQVLLKQAVYGFSPSGEVSRDKKKSRTKPGLSISFKKLVETYFFFLAAFFLGAAFFLAAFFFVAIF